MSTSGQTRKNDSPQQKNKDIIANSNDTSKTNESPKHSGWDTKNAIDVSQIGSKVTGNWKLHYNEKAMSNYTRFGIAQARTSHGPRSPN